MKIIQINPKALLPLGVTQQPPHPAELGEQRGPAWSQDSLPRSFQDIFDLIIIPISLRDPQPMKGFSGEDSEPSPRVPLPRAARPAAFTSPPSSPALLGSIPSPGPARPDSLAQPGSARLGPSQPPLHSLGLGWGLRCCPARPPRQRHGSDLGRGKGISGERDSAGSSPRPARNRFPLYRARSRPRYPCGTGP